MEAPDIFIGTSDECDFELNTWTFSFYEPFKVGAGKYAILRISDYQKLIDEIERLQKLATCECGDEFTEHDSGKCVNCLC